MEYVCKKLWLLSRQADRMQWLQFPQRLALLSILAGCAPGIAAQDRVHDALLAQVEGLGGCGGIDAQREARNAHFPSVRFIHGSCDLEHGETAFSLVAVDDAGLLYLLDSPSAFNFLVRTHPPINVDSSTTLEYARMALRMMGQISGTDSLLLTPDELPAAVLARYGARAQRIPRSAVLRPLREGYLVSVTTLNAVRIANHEAVVYVKTGAVRVTTRNQWRAVP